MPPKFQKSKQSSSGGLNLLRISWLFICAWIGVLVYCWQSGMLHASNNETLRYVDKVLNETEVKLVAGIVKTEHDIYEGIIKTENSLNHLRENIQHLNFERHIPGISSSSTSNMDGKKGSVRPPAEKYDIHVIFSTDCTPYQDWQSLVVFHSATVVKQKGPVTRIASGCDDEKKAYLSDLYAKLYPQYHVHFTPDFKKDEHSKQSYDFYNKPWGLKHWLEHADPPVQDDSVVALIDPDFVFIRPLTTQLRGVVSNLYHKKLEPELFDTVSEGHPVAQIYGLGAPWTRDDHPKFNRTFICGTGSPCLETELRFGEQHYAVGPPYIVHKSDMIKIAATWTKFVPRVYRGYPYLLAEMYAYSMAAAHERLPHFQLEQHMVSNIDAGDEGWPHIDALDNPCAPPVDGIYFPDQPMPTFVHFCQNYMVNNVGFAKRRVPRDIFTCESPMFVDLPNDLGKTGEDSFRIKKDKRVEMDERHTKRNAFVLCAAHRSINSALLDYKQRMCEGQKTNYDHTLNVLGQ